MDWINLIISLVSGLVGGNAAGAAFKDNALGGLGNSVTGLIGGGIGTYLLQAFDLYQKIPAGQGLDISHILATVGSGGVGGAVLLAIVTLIKNALNKS
jgi:uncharacterized membrane protein YeaQ/YmgE (transglycosylase-associated protein family)